MSRDLRDPKALGDALLRAADKTGMKIREIGTTWQTPNYDANPGPLEKYGDPTKLPSTLPN